ncbi:auxin-repressed 12.5 kDa protein [Dorcoceras hygrometricum]|uniref:Auxin-repressed 12.5 kDa protein n=1 Tax=Dorcoceras hygrometricum TaxID=472368 RepID=A0A2Z7C5N6_9LAMI|nr:auxin-repressed 12.5 kDa protein [Dorcoceras hygrometricum]
MGLLDQLWDDTVAGPLPENGLGKLRKHSTFGFRSNSGNGTPQFLSSAGKSESSNRRSLGEEAAEDATRVTRSIMIVKPPQLGMKDSPPVSPAGSTPPVSPFSGGGREAFRFRRKSASFAYERASGIGPRSPPPPYDL